MLCRLKGLGLSPSNDQNNCKSSTNCKWARHLRYFEPFSLLYQTQQYSVLTIIGRIRNVFKSLVLGQDQRSGLRTEEQKDGCEESKFSHNPVYPHGTGLFPGPGHTEGSWEEEAQEGVKTRESKFSLTNLLRTRSCFKLYHDFS